MENRYAITFGEVAILHIGGKEYGKGRLNNGFSTHELKKIAKTLMSIKIDGLIATNTTSNHQSAHGKGGISGKPLFKKSTLVLKLMRSLLGKEFPIIASGGVTDRKTYEEKINSGADLLPTFIFSKLSVTKEKL